MREWPYTVLFGVLAAGCSGKTIDAGGNNAGGNDAGGRGDDAGTPTPGAQTNVATRAFKGYIESFMFRSGSDAVVMNLAFAADGTVAGTVFFGDESALPPPTNPDVGYPPGYESFGQASPEGFNFTVLQGKDIASRVTLQIDLQEMWKKWCEIQTTTYPLYQGGSVDSGIVGYGCLPDDGWSGGPPCSLVPPQGSPIPVDCGKLQLCSLQVTCRCTQASCTVPVGPTGGVAFDMQLMGDALTGSVTGLSTTSANNGQVYNVHLTGSP